MFKLCNSWFKSSECFTIFYGKYGSRNPFRRSVLASKILNRYVIKIDKCFRSRVTSDGVTLSSHVAFCCTIMFERILRSGNSCRSPLTNKQLHFAMRMKPLQIKQNHSLLLRARVVGELSHDPIWPRNRNSCCTVMQRQQLRVFDIVRAHMYVVCVYVIRTNWRRNGEIWLQGIGWKYWKPTVKSVCTVSYCTFAYMQKCNKRGCKILYNKDTDLTLSFK